MTPTVPASGPSNAPLALVGRDPGWMEVRDGRPFVGVAGKILDAGLLDVGMPRSSVLVSNVVGVRPPGDAWSAHRDTDVDIGMRALRALLSLHPRVVLALGAQAFWACATGDPPPRDERTLERLLAARFGGSITELRGYVWDGAFGPTVAAVHPAFVARTWLPWRATLSWDLAKAKRFVEQRGKLAPMVARAAKQSIYAEGEDAAEIHAAQLGRADVLACDIETAGTGEPVCVAFAGDANVGVCFVLPRDTDVVRALLSSRARKVFMNGQFDVTVLQRAGFEVANWTDDIMLMWHALEPLIAGKSESGAKQSQKSLRFLASVFTDEPFWKNYDFETEEDRWRLCASDARVTWEIWEKLSSKLSK